MVIGLEQNYQFLKKHRESVPNDFPLMVDCYMALTAQYAIALAKKCEDLNINWWEEVLHPDDIDGFIQIKQAHPLIKNGQRAIRIHALWFSQINRE